MRVKRVEKFRRERRRKKQKLLFFTLILPCMCVFIGYMLTSLIILPAMIK